MKYDCEIEGCNNKTDDYLCSIHKKEAERGDMKIIYCNNCGKILKIVPKKLDQKDSGYESVKFCMRCKKKADEFFDTFFP